jgi:hypothetical protein
MISASPIFSAGFSAGELSVDPAFPIWFMLPVFLAAIAFVIYLGASQAGAVSSKIMFILSVLRVGLLILLFALLLRPFWQWTNTSHTSGTLWFLVDQSPSMAAVDAQFTDIEKLRWADALGYLNSSIRKYRPEMDHAEIVCLRADFNELSNLITRTTSPQDAESIEKINDNLNRFVNQLDAAIKSIKKAPSAPATAFSPLDESLRLARAMKSNAGNLKPGGKFSQIASADLAITVFNNLTEAARILEVHANQVDTKFLAARGGESAIVDALAKVAPQARSQIALTMITAAAKREGLTIPELLKKFRVRIATFSDSASAGPSLDVMSADEAFQTALKTTGNATDIASGLRLIAQQLGPEEPASVIIVSDGRNNAPRSEPEAAARDLLNRKAPVHVHGLLIGSRQVSPDAAAEHPLAREWIFKDDTLNIVAPVRLDGLSGKSVTAELYRDGKRIDTKNISAGAASSETQRLTFADKPPDVKAYEYEVRVLPVKGESNLTNNSQKFRVAVKKDKLYALLIEEEPRWEWQYLRNHLARDQRLKLQSVLLKPARIEGIGAPPKAKASTTNPSIEAQLLPETLEEWSAFDLIVLGDVGPDALPVASQQFIAATIRDKGATLIAIAGPANMPHRYAGAPLAEMFPVTLASPWNTGEIEMHIQDRAGFRPAATNEGDNVLRDFGFREAATLDGPPAAWEVWHWHSPFTAAKPGAQTIFTISENGKSSRLAARDRALIATMNIGLGKSLYVASDQTWRWRYLNGEDGQERFWGQVVRWSVGADLPAGGKYVRFGAERPIYDAGTPVIITARVLRDDLTPYTGLRFSAIAKSGASTTEAAFEESRDAPGYYHATIAGIPPGQAEISLKGSEVERLLNNDPTVTQRTVIVTIIAHANREQVNTNTDFEELTRITSAAGGVTLMGDSSDVLANHLPEIQSTFHTVEQVGFFTDPRNPYTAYSHWFFLCLFALVATIEWAIRKRVGLV